MSNTSTFAGRPGARPITLPVELSPRLHRQLVAWCQDTAEALDVRALARSDVIETLLEYLVEDDTASAAVQPRSKRALPRICAPPDHHRRPRRPLPTRTRCARRTTRLWQAPNTG